jgi:cell division protein FtsB
MKEVVEAIAEAVKAEMESVKEEIEAMKAKIEKMEEAPATEKSAPASFSAKSLFGKAEAEPFNKDRFEAVMARFVKK